VPPIFSSLSILPDVKNQFFADKRDFLKYDFLLSLMEGTLGLRRFTFVPMLTPDDGTSDGSLTDYPPGLHPRRQDLWNFLRECLKRGERDIRKLHVFMRRKPFEYLPCCDDVIFTHAGRTNYFAGIPSASLRKALVFFDPDNGFEVMSMTARNGDKYLRYDELNSVISRMDDESVAIVYQHLPRKSRDIYFAETARDIRRCIRIRDVLVVTDNVIAFFVLPKGTSMGKSVRQILPAYAEDHGLKHVDCR
jgi:hypothetical protein